MDDLGDGMVDDGLRFNALTRSQRCEGASLARKQKPPAF